MCHLFLFRKYITPRKIDTWKCILPFCCQTTLPRVFWLLICVLIYYVIYAKSFRNIVVIKTCTSAKKTILCKKYKNITIFVIRNIVISFKSNSSKVFIDHTRLQCSTACRYLNYNVFMKVEYTNLQTVRNKLLF